MKSGNSYHNTRLQNNNYPQPTSNFQPNFHHQNYNNYQHDHEEFISNGSGSLLNGSNSNSIGHMSRRKPVEPEYLMEKNLIVDLRS